MKEMQIRLQIKDFIVEKKFSYHNMQNNKMEKMLLPLFRLSGSE